MRQKGSWIIRCLAESYPNDDPESLVELVCEVLCSSMPSIRLGGENLPTLLSCPVRLRLLTAPCPR